MNNARFATTQWSLVLAAADRNSAAAEAALSRLCHSYWYPVFAFVRRQGHSVEDAQDLTQSFFTRVIEKGDLGDADQSRGRFRSFLLTACRHFLSNERDRAAAQKRGGDRTLVSIDAELAEDRYQSALAHEETPERLFDRQWALTLLDSVLESTRADYAEAGNAALFDRLKGFLTMDDEGSQSEAAADLNMTPGAVKVAVHRLRRRYRDALRQHISDTVESPQDVEEEMRYLLRAIRRV